jgi:virulence factor
MAWFPKELLKQYKKLKKKQFLDAPSKFRHKYAVVGAGSHAMTNLFPSLWYLGVPIARICTATAATANSVALRWKDCTGTDNIQDILGDKSISGVIVCTRPELHASITEQLLRHNKHVFVEKPVGYSPEELENVIAAQAGHICHVNLQRRFSAVTAILVKKVKQVISYNYRFCVGAYPEGNAVYDVFIHPVDHVIQLFGKASVKHITIQSTGSKTSCFLVLDHKGVPGVLELSTNHSWEKPVDEMTITTSSSVITARYPNYVSAVVKPTSVLGIPVEKLLRQPVIEKTYLDGNHFIATPELNSSYLQGFLPSLRQFTLAVENNQRSPLCSLESLQNTYEILKKISEASA